MLEAGPGCQQSIEGKGKPLPGQPPLLLLGFLLPTSRLCQVSVQLEDGLVLLPWNAPWWGSSWEGGIGLCCGHRCASAGVAQLQPLLRVWTVVLRNQDRAVQEAAALWILSPPVCGFLTVFWLFSLKLECDKLASEKSEMQRHYVMVRMGPGSPERVGGMVGTPVSRCPLGCAWQRSLCPVEQQVSGQGCCWLCFYYWSVLSA